MPFFCIWIIASYAKSELDKYLTFEGKKLNNFISFINTCFSINWTLKYVVDVCATYASVFFVLPHEKKKFFEELKVERMEINLFDYYKKQLRINKENAKDFDETYVHLLGKLFSRASDELHTFYCNFFFSSWIKWVLWSREKWMFVSSGISSWNKYNDLLL